MYISAHCVCIHTLVHMNISKSCLYTLSNVYIHTRPCVYVLTMCIHTLANLYICSSCMYTRTCACVYLHTWPRQGRIDHIDTVGRSHYHHPFGGLNSVLHVHMSVCMYVCVCMCMYVAPTTTTPSAASTPSYM